MLVSICTVHRNYTEVMPYFSHSKRFESATLAYNWGSLENTDLDG